MTIKRFVSIAQLTVFIDGAMLTSVWIVNSRSFGSELFKLHVMECLSNGLGQRSLILGIKGV